MISDFESTYEQSPIWPSAYPADNNFRPMTVHNDEADIPVSYLLAVNRVEQA